MINRFSAHKFTNESDITFSPEMYSKFKFGCKNAARQFGTELAKKFIKSIDFKVIKLQAKVNNRRIIVLSSPYVHIPTATFALKDYFIREFNSELINNDLEPVLEAKIYRKSSYKEEYGEMTKEERFKIMENDSFYVDANLLKNNICIFLDDIVITGAHEHRIMSMLKKYGIDNNNNNYFLYFAELTNSDTNPVIEKYLNYFFVKNLKCLDKIIKNEEHLINTRTVKYILDAPHNECVNFLDYQKHTFIHTLYHQAIGNGYHKIDDYSKNLKYVKSLLNS
jgi:hypothetical protein